MIEPRGRKVKDSYAVLPMTTKLIKFKIYKAIRFIQSSLDSTLFHRCKILL